MRDYELTVLLKPELSDKELDKEVKGLAELLAKAGAKILRKDDPKKQKLAYVIAKKGEAFYIFLELNLKPEDVGEVEQKLKLQENLIRYLLIKKE
jgi:small subunit ribosomal protein S6